MSIPVLHFVWLFAYSSPPSVSFEKYPEDNVAATYGDRGPDPYGKDFPDFDYTSI